MKKNKELDHPLQQQIDRLWVVIWILFIFILGVSIALVVVIERM